MAVKHGWLRIESVAFTVDGESQRQVIARHGDGKIVGLATMTVNRAWSLVGLNNVWVERNYRRKGIGGLMLQTCCDLATEAECRRMVIHIDNRNHDGQAFWQLFGFEAVAAGGGKELTIWTTSVAEVRARWQTLQQEGTKT